MLPFYLNLELMTYTGSYSFALKVFQKGAISTIFCILFSRLGTPFTKNISGIQHDLLNGKGFVFFRKVSLSPI